MKSVQKGLPSLSLNLLLVIRMIWEKHLSPEHSSMFCTRSFSCSSQREDGKSRNTLGVIAFVPFTVHEPYLKRRSVSRKVPKNLQRGSELDPGSFEHVLNPLGSQDSMCM